jgi:hypothetical protein
MDTHELLLTALRALVVVEGSGRTLSLPVTLVREHGLWRIDRLPQPPF